MKLLPRIILIVLVVALLAPISAFCIELNYDKMAEEELQSVIDQARLAMTKYHPLVEEGAVLYSDKSVSVIYAGTCDIDMFADLVIDVIITNNTNKTIRVALEDESCNGWAVDTIISSSIPAHKKAKTTFKVSDIVHKVGIYSAYDVKEIEANIYYFDEATCKNMIKPQHVIWNFNE